MFFFNPCLGSDISCQLYLIKIIAVKMKEHPFKSVQNKGLERSTFKICKLIKINYSECSYELCCLINIKIKIPFFIFCHEKNLLRYCVSVK